MKKLLFLITALAISTGIQAASVDSSVDCTEGCEVCMKLRCNRKTINNTSNGDPYGIISDNYYWVTVTATDCNYYSRANVPKLTRSLVYVLGDDWSDLSYCLDSNGTYTSGCTTAYNNGNDAAAWDPLSSQCDSLVKKGTNCPTGYIKNSYCDNPPALTQAEKDKGVIKYMCDIL